jgi:hypothetical protein
MDPDTSAGSDPANEPRTEQRTEARTELSPLEVLLFAPLGFVLKAGVLLPEWVEAGRKEYNKRAPVARLMGKLIVEQQRKSRQAAVVRSVSGRPPSGAAAAAAAALAVPSVAQPSGAVAGTDENVTHQTVSDRTPLQERPADLPIDGYDTLPARSLLSLFDGLSRPQLVLIRDYEQQHRQRATVLNRLSELLA